MKKKNPNTSWMLPLFLVVTVMLVFSLISAEDNPGAIAIIVNAGSSVPSNVTLADIKNIYLGQSRFLGNQKMLPAELKAKSVMGAFLKQTLGISETAYRSVWVKKVFSEGAQPPRQMSTTSEVLEFVSENRSAIGFVPYKVAEGKAGIKVMLTIQDGQQR